MGGRRIVGLSSNERIDVARAAVMMLAAGAQLVLLLVSADRASQTPSFWFAWLVGGLLCGARAAPGKGFGTAEKAQVRG